jgi:hypothetical protein
MANEGRSSERPGRAAADTTATEKPAKAAPAARTSQYIVTIDNATGIPLKIEKLQKPGERRELGAAEFARVAATAGAAASAPAEDPTAILQAYYKGIADYLNAVVGLK